MAGESGESRFLTQPNSEKKIPVYFNSLFLAFNYLSDFVYLQKKDYSIEFFNKEFESIFHKPGTRKCFKIFKNKNEPCDPCNCFDMFQRDKPFQWECKRTGGNIYRIKNLPLLIGREQMLLCIGNDISQSGKIKLDNRKPENQFFQENKTQAIALLAGGTLHDLNNILTGIKGFGEMIRKSLDDQDPLCKDVAEIIMGAREAYDLVYKLQEFFKTQEFKKK